MYKVICRFADKLDENYIYEVGDIYPREGVKPAKTRIEELASDKNAAGKVLIEELMTEPKEDVEIISEEETEPEEEKEAKPKAKSKK